MDGARVAYIVILIVGLIVRAVANFRPAFDGRRRHEDEIPHPEMKSARVFQQGQLAGFLEAHDDGTYRFRYEPGYVGEPVSLTMPRSLQVWDFTRFPAPFEGLLPEGVQLDALLRLRKLDRTDLFGQLLAVGSDVVGSLQIEEAQ